MSATVNLPGLDGSVAPFTFREASAWTPPSRPFRSRIAYAAAHVVVDPRRDVDVFVENAIDWECTLAFRRHLWRYGFSVAEAMDTAQRGGGLTWTSAQELIRRALAESRAEGGGIACGAGTDHLAASPTVTIADVSRAYAEQVGFGLRNSRGHATPPLAARRCRLLPDVWKWTLWATFRASAATVGDLSVLGKIFVPK